MKYTSLKMILGLMLVLGLAFAQDNDSTDWDWMTLGEENYKSTCMACHQATGAGIPGAFPPLAENLPRYAGVEGGREYLINVILYGLAGKIEILDKEYNGAMPAWGSSLSDEQVAAVLNHELHSWGNDEMLPEDFAVIAVEEVTAQREVEKTQEEVHALREALDFEVVMESAMESDAVESDAVESMEDSEDMKDSDQEEEKSDS